MSGGGEEGPGTERAGEDAASAEDQPLEVDQPLDVDAVVGEEGAFDEDADRSRVRREIMVLTGVGLLLIAVFGPITYVRSWVDEQVVDATVVSPTELQLAVGGCGLDRRVLVVERDREVEVRVQHRRSADADGCIDTVSARLDAPLGDRRVVDASDGVSIPVCESAEPFGECATR